MQIGAGAGFGGFRSDEVGAKPQKNIVHNPEVMRLISIARDALEVNEFTETPLRCSPSSARDIPSLMLRSSLTTAHPACDGDHNLGKADPSHQP
jgi:hypothetical protein